MNTVRYVLSLVVGFFAVLFAPPAKAQACVNAATVQLENLWRTVQAGALRGMLQVQLAADRIFGIRTPFAVGITADEKILETLEKVDKKLGDVAEVKKTVEEQKKTADEQKQTVAKLTTDLAEIQQKYADLAKHQLEVRTHEAPRVRMPGRVSDACAKHLAAQFILHCERSNKLEGLASEEVRRTQLSTVARQVLGIQGKTAISTSDIPLPTSYSSEIKELTSEFGVCRRLMSPYPIGMGTAKPARWGTRPAFGSIAMSAAITEKSPTLTFASLESHKVGGLVRLPREIDEQSIVPMGQYLARYGAVEFARAEDTWGFLADGTSTYESVSGIVKIATDNSKSVVLAAATGPHDATLADFRAMRTKVNKACLSAKRSRYFMDSTWETRLPTFKTEADEFAYVRNADGTATLDGYPIEWVDVLEPYGTSNVTSKPLACFGAIDYWWMGEHGSPRIDTSEHVFFANDQLAVRFIEEIDFDYAALDAMSVLLTGAAS